MGKRDFGLGILDETRDTGVSFVLSPENVSRTYGVRLKFEDELKKELLVHYEIDVICLEKIDEDIFILELNKKQVFLDNKAPDMLMDQFAEQCGNVIYPLQVHVNSNYSILDIANYDEIMKRWQAKRGYLSKEFSGEQIEDLLRAMDIMLSDSTKMINELKEQDWFINLFFTPLNSAIVRNENNEIKIPLIPYDLPVLFKTMDNITNHKKRKKDVIVSRKGIYNDARTEIDFLTGNVNPLNKKGKKPIGTAELTYHLYDTSSIWDAIFGSCSLILSTGVSRVVNIEIHNLKRKKPKSSIEQREEVQIIDNNKPEPQKKKKRYFIFGKELKLSGF